MTKEQKAKADEIERHMDDIRNNLRHIETTEKMANRTEGDGFVYIGLWMKDLVSVPRSVSSIVVAIVRGEYERELKTLEVEFKAL